jgi:hypothetical protein
MSINESVAGAFHAAPVSAALAKGWVCGLLERLMPDHSAGMQLKDCELRSAWSLPAMHSLASRRIQLRFTDHREIAVFNVESRQLRVSRKLAREMKGAAEEVRWAFYECLGRWTLLMAAQAEGAMASRTSEAFDAWLKFFALRPFLYLAWKHGCCPVGPALPVTKLRNLVESSAATPRWEEALQRFSQALSVRTEEKPNALERCHLFSSRRQIVGFQHTRDGIVLAIFGSGSFRHLSAYNAPRKSVAEQRWLRFTSNLLVDGEKFAPRLQQAELRRCRLTPLKLVPCASAKVVNTRLRRSTVVRELLGSGKIPITTTETNDSGWALLMSSAEIRESGQRVGASGRTGVLFKDGVPVIEEVDGVQYLVEVKGAGSVDGGMPSLMKRADGTWSPTGGMLRSYANDEYAALLEYEETKTNGVKALALLHCGSEDLIRRPYLIGAGHSNRQLEDWPQRVQDEVRKRLAPGLGMVFRLTFSSERLSFFECDGKRRNRCGPSVSDRVSIYGAAIARLFLPGRMKAHLSAHLENLASGDFGFFWQDFADILPLYTSRGHYATPDMAARKTTTLRLLNQTFFYVARTAQVFYEYFGVGYSEFSSNFYRAFAQELQHCWPLKSSFISDLAEMKEPLRVRGEGITSFLWKGWIAADNFLWCLEHYDLPGTIFGSKHSPATDHAPVAFDTARLFLQTEQEFLLEAALPTGLNPDFLAPPAQQLLADSQERAMELIAGIAEGRQLTAADCRLPYLCKSQYCALPRKVESWPK